MSVKKKVVKRPYLLGCRTLVSLADDRKQSLIRLVFLRPERSIYHELRLRKRQGWPADLESLSPSHLYTALGESTDKMPIVQIDLSAHFIEFLARNLLRCL